MNSDALAAARLSRQSTGFGAQKAPRIGSAALPGYKGDTPGPSYFQGCRRGNLDQHLGRCGTPDPGTPLVVG